MKATELLLSKESGKKKKRNCFDKDWTDKHAASDKGSYDKQHEFEEGQDFEEAAIDGFFKPYKAFIKDQTARQWVTSLGVSVSLESVVVA